MKEFDEYDDFQTTEQEEKSVDLMPYVRKALKGWKTILLCALIGAVIGVVIGVSTPKSYTSRAVVAPEILTRSNMGSGLSSLASMAGINVNSMALTDAMHPDMYPEIIHSPEFYIKLFDMPVTVETKDSLVHTDLYDYMVNYTKHPWWSSVIGLPFMLSDKVKGLFSKKNDFDETEGHEVVDSLRLTRQQEGVVKALSKCINAVVEKRTYLLSLSVTTQDPVISADLANAVVDNLRNFVVTYRTEKSRDNLDYFKGLYDETRSEYLKAQRAYAGYVDSHQNITSRSTLVYQQQLQNEAQLKYQMYSQTSQNLMNAEAKVQQEAPVLVVIQPGIAPRSGHPSRIKIAFLWLVLGGALGLAFVLFGKKQEED